MGYIDENNIRHEDNSFQDIFLKKIYGCVPGRAALKLFTLPVISKIGGAVLSLPLSAAIIGPFIEKNGIDMSEYSEEIYHSYNDFFKRKIEPSKRPIEANEDTLISPCDGRVSVYPITEDGVFEIKNAPYNVYTLLRDKKLAKKYDGGYCILIRLCVTDYHRYCFASSGIRTKTRRIDGILHTVNPIASEYFPIYKENTREYTGIRTQHFGDIIQMEVGAMMVGKISNHRTKREVIKGQEKGYFEFGGSTVILLVEKDRINIKDEYINNSKVGYETLIRQGEVLGYEK